MPTDFHPSVLGNNKLLTTMSPHMYQVTKQAHNGSACGGFRLVSQSSGTSQMTDCCLLMCFRFGWENLHLVLTVPAKNLCSHTSLWSSARQPERDANLGVESEIVQLGHSCASKQSRHMDRSGADGFWISLPRSREELMHCASLGHVDIPHTSLLFRILWSLYYT